MILKRFYIFALLFMDGNCKVPDEVETKNANIYATQGHCLRVIETISNAFTHSVDSKTCDPTVKNPAEVVENFTDKENLRDTGEYYAKNCFELQLRGDIKSGIRTMYPFRDSPSWGIKVPCNQETDGGGWTVFQTRDDLPLREDFQRTWVEYSLGFGNLTGEFWLGLDNIYALTNNVLMELRVDLEDSLGERRFAKFGFFSIGNSAEKYILNVGRYSGDAGDVFSNLDKMKFTTQDQDNDIYDKNCAVVFKGAWWYTKCHGSNLNGYYYVGNHTSYGDGIIWRAFKGYYNSLKKTTMMVRPAFRRRN